MDFSMVTPFRHRNITAFLLQTLKVTGRCLERQVQTPSRRIQELLKLSFDVAKLRVPSLYVLLGQRLHEEVQGACPASPGHRAGISLVHNASKCFSRVICINEGLHEEQMEICINFIFLPYALLWEMESFCLKRRKQPIMSMSSRTIVLRARTRHMMTCIIAPKQCEPAAARIVQMSGELLHGVVLFETRRTIGGVDQSPAFGNMLVHPKHVCSFPCTILASAPANEAAKRLSNSAGFGGVRLIVVEISTKLGKLAIELLHKPVLTTL